MPVPTHPTTLEAVESLELTNEEMILGFLAEGGDGYVSGAVLSDKLGLSRTAVWKYVETLRRLGYRIDAQPSRGYRLLEVPDRLTMLELSPLLTTRDLGRTLHYFETIGSTNEKALELARDGAFHGDIVIAEQQTEGKGRRGRAWITPPGKNLAMSVVLRPELPPSRAPEVTLVAAVALAETLNEAGVTARIKWPNDVQLEGKKVAGILTELMADTERVQAIVLGLGVNLNSGPDDFPDEVKALSTSVRTARGSSVPRALFTSALLSHLEGWLERWTQEGFEPVRSAWKALSATLGKEILVKGEKVELRGVAEDIDEGGALLVRTEKGLERVLAGDVEEVRPRGNA